MGLESAAAARHAAQQILAEGRFHQPAVPRPLHGLAEAVGNLLSDPLGALERLVLRIGRVFPGGVTGLWVLLAALVLAAAGLLASRRARTALADPREARTPHQGPAELERAAVLAEREGRLADAVRLRFRAGLIRLAERSGLPSPQTTPSHEIARLVGSERFERLSTRFDEIAYGGAPATGEDVAAQRREWPEILSRGAAR